MSFKDWQSASLEEVCFFGSDKIVIEKVSLNNYISTENMLPDKGGITIASGLPTTKTVSKFEKSDILISNIRPYFKKIWFATKSGGCSNDVLIFKNKVNGRLDNKYLYYNLKKDDFFNFMTASAKGTKMPRGDKDAIMKYKINLPSLEEQKSIASILSSLDEKIETNNQINNKLEEMAQAIFKQWFVDFEFPNEDGEPYKSSDGEMVESELGSIPKGWELTTFRSFTRNVLGGDWGKENEQGNYQMAVNCLRGADIPEVSEGRIGSLPKRYILEKNYNNKKLNSGDLVVEISGGSPTQSTGRITYINDLMLNKYDQDFVCTNFCRAITLKDPMYMYYFYFYWKMLYDLNVFFQYENGTTGIKNFDINTFLDKFLIISPGKELIKRFDKVVKPLVDRIQMNGSENLKIAEIRDTLLPKLMSGEIRVPIES
ncbi:MAG TPA: restriction endonuclease subunit S [Neobacillus sp.]